MSASLNRPAPATPDPPRPADAEAVASRLARREALAESLAAVRREMAPAKRTLDEAVQAEMAAFRSRDPAAIARTKPATTTADEGVRGLRAQEKVLLREVAAVEADLALVWKAAAAEVTPAWDAEEDRLVAAYRAARDAFTAADAALQGFKACRDAAFAPPDSVAKRPVKVRLLCSARGYAEGEIIGLPPGEAGKAVEQQRAEYI